MEGHLEAADEAQGKDRRCDSHEHGHVVSTNPNNTRDGIFADSRQRRWNCRGQDPGDPLLGQPRLHM